MDLVRIINTLREGKKFTFFNVAKVSIDVSSLRKLWETDNYTIYIPASRRSNTQSLATIKIAKDWDGISPVVIVAGWVERKKPLCGYPSYFQFLIMPQRNPIQEPYLEFMLLDGFGKSVYSGATESSSVKMEDDNIFIWSARATSRTGKHWDDWYYIIRPIKPSASIRLCQYRTSPSGKSYASCSTY